LIKQILISAKIFLRNVAEIIYVMSKTALSV